jgi:DNA-binding GntR family transcriptional regulator
MANVYRRLSTMSPPPNLTTPISRKQSLREIVHERVRGALLSGEIAPGERFTESQLAEGLGTSRAPIREALRQLEQEGLIVPTGQRGYALRPVEAHDVHELGLLRCALERLAAELVVERADDAGIAELKAVVTQMYAAESETAPQAKLTELDATFHELLCRLAQHEPLLRVWSSMRDQLTLAMRTVNLAWSPGPGYAASHERVVQALETRDVATAQRAIEEHIRSGLAQLVSDADGGEPEPAAR